MQTTSTTPAMTRAHARLCHKVDRQWMKGAPAPMPKHWRTVCGAALAMAPKAGADPKFHRALVASLRFALPRGQRSSLDAWTSDPLNLAALAVDLLPVIRKHARTVS